MSFLAGGSAPRPPRRHPRILIVDDQVDTLESLIDMFRHAGAVLAVAHDGAQALDKVASFAPHVILLDVAMPVMDGREFLRRLRQRDRHTAVIMLSQFGAATERGQAILEGADDYINKPFDDFELWARVQAALRRVAASEPSRGSAQRLASGDVVLDRRAGVAYLCRKPLDLAPKSLQVLDYLLCHPNELLARERFLTVIWGYTDDVGVRILDNHICSLRRALKDDARAPRYIESVSGQGYRWIRPVEIMA